MENLQKSRIVWFYWTLFFYVVGCIWAIFDHTRPNIPGMVCFTLAFILNVVGYRKTRTPEEPPLSSTQPLTPSLFHTTPVPRTPEEARASWDRFKAHVNKPTQPMSIADLRRTRKLMDKFGTRVSDLPENQDGGLTPIQIPPELEPVSLYDVLTNPKKAE